VNLADVRESVEVNLVRAGSFTAVEEEVADVEAA